MWHSHSAVPPVACPRDCPARRRRRSIRCRPGRRCADLPGGQERTWTDGQIVLKPVDNPVEHSWVFDVFDAWPDDVGVRVPRGLRSPDGSWVYDGWAAHGFVPGRSARMTWEPEVIRSAGEAFHRQTAALDRPGFLDERTDAWSEGDRVAWEDADPVAADVTLEQIHRLRAAFAPVEGASQVIHGDLGGNVLVSDDGGPVVIDWPPYFRPPGFALARRGRRRGEVGGRAGLVHRRLARRAGLVPAARACPRLPAGNGGHPAAGRTTPASVPRTTPPPANPPSPSSSTACPGGQR